MQSSIRCTSGTLRSSTSFNWRLCFTRTWTTSSGFQLGSRSSTNKRQFSVSSRKLQAGAADLSIDHSKHDLKVTEDSFVYNGPLSKPFRNLKMFSLASIGLSISLSPLLFIVESGLPMSARLALTGVALGSSGLSTSLIAWCAKPYVTTMRRFRPDRSGSAEEIEMTTYNLFLRPLVTRVYDSSFLIETRRPMAKWELADEIHLTQSRQEAVGTNVHPEEGLEETVAETRNQSGDVIGRWVVKWGPEGKGNCQQVGNVVRYFNIHEELLK